MANPDDQLYPGIESFIEVAGPDHIAAMFAPIREALETLKGPKAANAKKIGAALTRTEELLTHLLEVRARLEAERENRR